MLYCKKIKPASIKCSLLIVFIFLITSFVWEANAAIVIKSAELTPFEDEYFLSTNADIKLNDEIEQTLLKGFELHFILEFQLASPKKYWFDDEIITVTYPITLSYHPLSRQYLLIQAGQQKSYATLEEVALALSNLHHIYVFKKSDVEKAERYKALLLLRLDYKKLPKTIEDDVLNADKWSMTSQRFEWVPMLFK